ncbi:hypothetical protein PanWU01x14_033270 [Parasponia andersonii]|uniref:Uncharacterized protein n=1 Tax=Parasponia andersonii TaxID=3476 RepID=A0A2P5DTL9_PARAD|nr:hypothetical protein PanWU01x14_033270 [Parasponia andersonii]
MCILCIHHAYTANKHAVGQFLESSRQLPSIWFSTLQGVKVPALLSTMKNWLLHVGILQSAYISEFIKVH